MADDLDELLKAFDDEHNHNNFDHDHQNNNQYRFDKENNISNK